MGFPFLLCPLCRGRAKWQTCAKSAQEYSRFHCSFCSLWVFGGRAGIVMRNTVKMKRLVFFFLIASFTLLLFLAPSAKAQGTYTAASCNQSDVNAVINGPTHTAVDGDTIKI